MARKHRRASAQQRTVGKRPHTVPRRRLHNLPAQLTSFIGRDQEILEVKRLLTTARLLTLTGAGGSGKTRLALRVAADLLDQYPDGVWLVELAPLTDPSLVPDGVAAAIGVRDQAGRGLPNVIADYLQSKRLLLVVDNCEHVIEECATLIETLLRNCPHIRVLATSREALNVAGETPWRVPPLTIPDPAHLSPLDGIKNQAAVQLFVERAATVTPKFVLTSDNAAAIVEVCRRLDGMPLAIELAAARTRVLSPAQIAARLDDRFRLLTGSTRTAVPRHQTLRAVMDWSYDLLSLPEQAVLRRLAIFAGGATLDAAEAVCSGDGVPAADVLDLLTRLVDKSLVLAEPHDQGTRYRLLETTRQFGLDRLAESGEVDAVSRRHLTWYMKLAEDAYAHMWSPELPTWLSRLDAEHDNFRTALLSTSIDADAASGRARITWALLYYWFLRGHWTEARRWSALLLEQRGRVPPSMYAKLLGCASFFASLQGDPDVGVRLAEEALEMPDDPADPSTRTWLCHYKGMALRRQGDFTTAVAVHKEQLRLAQIYRQTHVAAIANAQLGGCAGQAGDLERAKAFHEAAHASARTVGDPFLIAFCLYGLGEHAIDCGNVEQAAAFYHEGLTYDSAIRSSWVIVGLIGLAGALRDYARAAMLLGAADANRRLIALALTPRMQDHYELAIRAVKAAMDPESFQSAYTEGGTMTIEQAIEFALASTPLQEPSPSPPVAARRRGDALTARELEIAALVARGLTNRAIATELVVSGRTADAHVQNILNKLGFSSRAQIAAWAVEQGLKDSHKKP